VLAGDAPDCWRGLPRWIGEVVAWERRPASGDAVPNRLADETSPYLRQHADNPVDWFPWGEDAFAEAKRRDVPIFLSVGYSSCHWGHVMVPELLLDPL
jgi:uncharacterized protein YyaL (SSP411 family)